VDGETAEVTLTFRGLDRRARAVAAMLASHDFEDSAPWQRDLFSHQG
jgi:hypothetical protein